MAVKLHGNTRLKAGLLKAKIEPADTREQTDDFQWLLSPVLRVDILSQYVFTKLYCQYRKLIRIRLREALESYHESTGKRLTYKALAEKTGISVETLQSMAARPGYNTRLSTIERLCLVLGCTPGDLLELNPSEVSDGQS